MAVGRKTGGRQKGTPNKTTVAVKDALTEAFENVGGVKSLVAWAKANETEFYKLWAKMLPTEVKANVESVGRMALISDQPMTEEQWAAQVETFN